MRILVPVDGSKNASEALQVAIDLAKAKGAEIYILSVVPYISGMEDHEISPARRERHMESMEKQAREVVKRATDALATAGLTSPCAKTVFADSSIPDAIIDFAETEKINLLIMGYRGVNTSTRYKVGGVATQVVKASPCSVYLVKMPA